MPEPYSILVRSRPRRVAFLVEDSQLSDDLLDAIYAFNLHHWGGRFNPIIRVSGDELSEPYQRLLEFADPDVVYSYGTLSHSLLAYLDRQIQPVRIECHRDLRTTDGPPNYYPSIAREALSVDAIIANADTLYRNPLSKPTLVIYDVARSWEHHRFILRNLGVSPLSWKIPRRLDNLETCRIDPSTPLPEILTQLGRCQRPIFPFRLCTDFADIPQQEHPHQEVHCLVTVGDDPRNSLLTWNFVFFLSTWQRKHLTTLWLPATLANSREVLPCLREFLQRQLYQVSQHPAMIQLTSFDWNSDRIVALRDFLAEWLDAVVQVVPKSSDDLPLIGQPRTYPPTPPFTDVQALSEQTYVPIPPPLPVPLEGTPLSWMVDLNIQYRPEKFHYTNQKYWWKLPRRSGLASLLAPQRPCRMDRQHHLSCEVSAGESTVGVSIPEDYSVWATIFVIASHPYYTLDRRQPKAPPYGDFRLSDKGRYLEGLLGLFPSLWHAAEFFENHFWREIVEEMSGQVASEQSETRAALANWLSKKKDKLLQDLREDLQAAGEWIADRALTLLHAGAERVRPFEWFLERLREERQAFNQLREEKDRFEDPDHERRSDMLDALERLTQAGVFFRGLRPRCPLCGSAYWYRFQELREGMRCRGCLSEFHLPIEERWYYALNGLVRNAVVMHGLVPVVLTLGWLEDQARESFLFSPPTKFHANRETNEALAELDIICIVDGELVIGEVKAKAEQFGRDEEHALEEAARRIRPERVVISAVRGNLEKLDYVAARLQESLRPLGVKVQAIKPPTGFDNPEFHI
jgi:hypothetical protein